MKILFITLLLLLIISVVKGQSGIYSVVQDQNGKFKLINGKDTNYILFINY